MKSEKITPIQQMKMDNIKKILAGLLTCGRGTKIDLVNQTGLSNSTLSDCINNLCEAGAVKTGGMEESGGGRRPTLYELNEEYGYFLGIAMDRGSVRGAVMDFAGRLNRSYPACEPDGRPVIRLVFDLIEQIQKDYAGRKLRAIGIGSEGVVDYELGIVSKCDQINWHNVHLKELIERKFFLPTYLDHKINNAALYESFLGHAKGIRNFLFQYQDCPDKTCLYLDGRLLRGEMNLAGTCDHLEMDREGIRRISQFLSLRAILYACTEKTKNLEELPELISFSPEQDYLPLAAALMAECEWYSSIYFHL